MDGNVLQSTLKNLNQVNRLLIQEGIARVIIKRLMG